MNMKIDRIRAALVNARTAVSTRHLSELLEEPLTGERLGAIELLCALNSTVSRSEGGWRASQMGKSSSVILALENFAASSGKRIFRASSALEGLTADVLPTQTELEELLKHGGSKFEMLPNGMIKMKN
jgi:hypothetical protein